MHTLLIALAWVLLSACNTAPADNSKPSQTIDASNSAPLARRRCISGYMDYLRRTYELAQTVCKAPIPDNNELYKEAWKGCSTCPSGTVDDCIGHSGVLWHKTCP